MKTCSTENCGRKVMARGLCVNCYMRWKRATNYRGFRDKEAERDKARSLKPNRAAYEEARNAKRKADPTFRDYRREIHRRYAERHDPAPIGATVRVAMDDLAQFSPNGKTPRKPCYEPNALTIKGVIVDRRRSQRLVRFATFEEWVPLPRLRKETDGARCP